MAVTTTINGSGTAVTINTIGQPSSVELFTTAQILLSGDSTFANFGGALTVASLVFNATEISKGYSATSMAVSGHTINSQETAWIARGDKANFDAIILQVGLNDLNPAQSFPAMLSRYQSYVDQIRIDVPDIKIITSYIIPVARARWPADTATAYQFWLDFNEAIGGQGSTPITDVDATVTTHVPLMGDGSDNLSPSYDTGDGIHPNNAGRTVNATAIRQTLLTFGW